MRDKSARPSCWRGRKKLCLCFPYSPFCLLPSTFHSSPSQYPPGLSYIPPSNPTFRATLPYFPNAPYAHGWLMDDWDLMPMLFRTIHPTPLFCAQDPIRNHKCRKCRYRYLNNQPSDDSIGDRHTHDLEAFQLLPEGSCCSAFVGFWGSGGDSFSIGR